MSLDYKMEGDKNLMSFGLLFMLAVLQDISYLLSEMRERI
jgi:hypothetical protein